MAQKTRPSEEALTSATTPETGIRDEDSTGGVRKGNRLPRQAAKRRPAAIAVAVALAVIGGLVAWSAFQSSGAKPYLVMNQSVERGDQITQTMLGSIDVVGEPGGMVAAENSASVIGQVATMDMAGGTAVTAENTAESLGVPEGTGVIGLALEAGQLPSRPLHAGDAVLIVETPAVGQGTTASPQDTEIRTIAGTVESTAVDEISGKTVVDVLVQAADSAQVAIWGASGAASLALQSSQGEQGQGE